MTEDETNHLTAAKLQPAEHVLWSYISEGGEKQPTSRSIHILGSGLQGLFVVGYLMFFLWTIKTTPASEIGGYVKTYAPWVAGFVILLWLLQKFEITQKLDRLATRKAFYSAIITNQRVILFNYDIENSVQIDAKNLTRACVDFHEGGQALLITSSQSKKDNVLVGIEDFTKAATLIQTHLISPTSPSKAQAI